MKKAVLFLAACLVSFPAFAQEIPEVPETDESKFQVIRDLSDKTKSIGGGAPLFPDRQSRRPRQRALCPAARPRFGAIP